MNRIRQLWSKLRSSFWFMPSMIVLASIALAAILIEIDSLVSDRWLTQWPRMFGAGAEGARGMMSTIAGSMMTVVGVTFSMVLMVLAMASSQYTSRILRNFIRSRVTQVVLGVFTGNFTYCLIVLRTIRSVDEGAFVPNLSVSFGFVLALGGVGVLIFFIHHIANSIQASSIIASVAHETIAAIDRLFPIDLVEVSDDDAKQLESPPTGPELRVILARESGYLQSVDTETLVGLARDSNTIVWMKHGMGEFVVQNTAMATLALHEPPDQATVDAIQDTFTISCHRTVDQDVAFGIRQIVDIAMKALSPGINDTTTAVMCVDYLTTILARVAPREILSSHVYKEGELRVFMKSPSFESLLAESFDQIRINAKGNVAIISRMLGSIQTLASLTVSRRRLYLLGEQVQWIADLAERSIESAHDRAEIDIKLTRLRESLQAEQALCAGLQPPQEHVRRSQLESKTSIVKGSPMLNHTLLSNEGTLILEPSGPLEAADFAAVTHDMDPYLAKHGSLAGVMIFAKAFPGWLNLEAAISHLRLIEKYHQKIKRLAIVSDNGLLSALPKFAAHLVHPDVKHFSESEYEDALQWLREAASPANQQQSVRMS